MGRLLHTALLVGMTLGMAYAQLDRGTLTGTVTDTSGAAIPGVRIVVQNVATGAQYPTQANETGQYRLPNLPNGSYQLTFEAPAFKKLVRRGIELGATQVVRVDVTLEVGSVSESVEVTAEVPRLQTDNPEVGTSLSSRQLVDLPLTFSGARTAESFAYKVSPGVSGGTWETNILGSTSFSKETLLEGATVTTERSGHFGESSVSVEALQEFKIQTSGISAEFGRTQVGVFNYVMKSGTNELHGSGYGQLRNEALNANTFVNKARGIKRSLDRRQDYAGSFGAPVYIPGIYHGRNRTFFFVTFERYRERTTGFRAPNITAPQPEFYDGNFSRLLGPVTSFTDGLGRQVTRGAIYDPASFRQLESGRWIGDVFPGNRIPVTRFSRVAQGVNAIAKAHYLPTVRDASGQIPLANNSIFPASGSPRFDQYQFSLKGDQTINSQHKIAGSYAYNARPMDKFDRGGLWDPADEFGGPLSKARYQRLKTQYGRAAYDWMVSPTILNHFIAYVNRTINPIGNVHRDTDGAKELGITGLSTQGYPTLDWGGGPFVTLDTPGHDLNKFFGLTGTGIMETLSFSKGRHFMKAGFDHRRNNVNNRWASETTLTFSARATAIPNEAFSGNQTGYAFASYLLGIVDSGTKSDPVPLGGRRHYYAAFFQDDFKVSRRLTLNLGLRWEYQKPNTEVANRLSSWNPNKTDPVTGLPGAYDFAGACQGCTGRTYFGVRHRVRDWGPRFGFAYQPLPRWTIRGAYGIIYEADMFNGALGAPMMETGSSSTNVAWSGSWRLSADPVQPWKGIFNWDNGFPVQRYAPPAFNDSWGNSNRPGMFDPDYGKSPYVQTWNLNVQREILRGLVLDVGYVGNQATGLHAGQLAVLNQLSPSVLSQYGRALNNAVRSAADAAANGIKYPFPGFVGTVASALRPYPQVLGNSVVDVYGSPLGFSTHHSLQVTVNRQFSRGLTVYANYVWSKTLANMQSSEPTYNTSRPLNYYNLKLEKALSVNDLPHMFKAYLDYELPIGRGKALWGGAGSVASAIFGGWSVSWIGNYFSGTPLGFPGSSPLVGGWNGVTNRANIAAGEMKKSGFNKSVFELSTLTSPNNTYLNKSLFSDAAPLTLGTAAFRYGQARNFGTINEDLGLQKNQRIREKYRLQIRAEFLNAFNRHQLSGINTSVTSPQFGQVTNVSGNRTVQVGVRFDF